jgi:hypothetical protein
MNLERFRGFFAATCNSRASASDTLFALRLPTFQPVLPAAPLVRSASDHRFVLLEHLFACG